MGFLNLANLQLPQQNQGQDQNNPMSGFMKLYMQKMMNQKGGPSGTVDNNIMPLGTKPLGSDMG